MTNGRTFADDFHRFRVDWDETGLTYYIDDEQLLHVGTDNGYFNKGGWDNRFGQDVNVWSQNGNLDAPFDQEFYLILNVAVGGTTGFFGDWINNPSYGKPWSDSSSLAMREFWEARNLWLPTWPDVSQFNLLSPNF